MGRIRNGFAIGKSFEDARMTRRISRTASNGEKEPAANSEKPSQANTFYELAERRLTPEQYHDLLCSVDVDAYLTLWVHLPKEIQRQRGKTSAEKRKEKPRAGRYPLLDAYVLKHRNLSNAQVLQKLQLMDGKACKAAIGSSTPPSLTTIKAAKKDQKNRTV